jgi:hypothetical protein
MTSDPDRSFAALQQTIKEFSEFITGKSAITEADTRANLIDKILTQVCAWPEAAITREDHVERGYIDYCLSAQTRPYIAVEAKREGISFTLPTTPHKSLKISGALSTDKAVNEAIHQVRGYCDDAGIRYAIATNGYAWIVFRAIREDMPWRNGFARVFPSLEYIEAHFTDFWNLLSFDAIQKGSLDAAFGSQIRPARQLLRVVDRLFNAGLPLQRNRLHAQLHPIMEAIFKDIADQDPLEILESCYVHTGSLRIVAQDLNAVITDSIPEFIVEQGGEEIVQGPDHAGSFGTAVAGAVKHRSGQLYLLLGGIGSGKTTFIKRYEREVGKQVLEGKTLWFHLDFLGAPVDPQTMEFFAWTTVLQELRGRYGHLNLETRRNIKKAFADQLEVLQQTVLKAYRQSHEAYEDSISPYLGKWVGDTSDYVPRLLKVASADRKLHIVLFIDNVDQLAPAAQALVFLLAQRVTRTVSALTILSLREESYYTANLKRTLTAYTNRKFHIASPRFRRMIDSRVRFALGVLEQSSGPTDYVLGHGIAIDRPAIADFLKIIETSIFEKNHNIARFIEALCFGNMRLALDMFTLFMTSGATDVDKMLKIYRHSGAYFVAFHEFVKSIMLGDRRYYKDESSDILNVFDCGAERNSSHFTSLRVIHALSGRRGESTREGQGFVEISKVAGMSEDVFDNREDVVRTLNRLVVRQLIESNTKSVETITGASHVRITSAGWYYARYLVRSFSYLDLVLQDTPVDDPNVEARLRAAVEEVGNLADREDEKLVRMQVRFRRVRDFVQYLRAQEEIERAEFSLAKRGGIWADPIMPAIEQRIEEEVTYIERRLLENRERFAEDLTFGGDGTAADAGDDEAIEQLSFEGYDGWLEQT